MFGASHQLCLQEPSLCMHIDILSFSTTGKVYKMKRLRIGTNTFRYTVNIDVSYLTFSGSDISAFATTGYTQLCIYRYPDRGSERLYRAVGQKKAMDCAFDNVGRTF